MTISTLSGVPYGPTPRAASYASALAQPPRLIVIHDTSNDATKEQEASYAANRTDDRSHWTSAHFYVDAGGPLGSLHLDKQAWAAYSYANSHGWHIEMCGYNTGMTKAVPPTTIAITAGLTRRLADAFAIPLVKLSPADVAAGKHGICGHWDITQGLNVGSHDDPGPKFDWAAFMALVINGEAADMTPGEHNTQIATDARARTLMFDDDYADFQLIKDDGTPGEKRHEANKAKAARKALEATIAQMAADLAVLKARPAVEAAPVDAAALKAVLLDPEVVAAYAKAAAESVHADLAD